MKRYFPWGVLLLCSGLTTINIIQNLEIRRARQELIQLTHDITLLQERQELLVDSYIKAWQNQQVTADLLTAWGGYYKERKFITTLNSRAVVDRRAPK